jgi:hypothetical protein
VASLVGLALRVAVGLAIALVAAIPMALLGFRDGFVGSFAVACFVVGCLALMMAFGGSSPSRRMGTQDAWFASFYPKLARSMGDQYPHPRLSDAAVFVLTGVALVVIGLALLG